MATHIDATNNGEKQEDTPQKDAEWVAAEHLDLEVMSGQVKDLKDVHSYIQKK